MTEHNVILITNALNRIEAKQRTQDENLKEIGERMARMETRYNSSYDDVKTIKAELSELSSLRNKGAGAMTVLVWLAAAVSSIVTAVISHITK